MGGSGLKEERARTGIEGLDSLTEGGFLRGSLVVVAGRLGSGKTIFAAQYLWFGLEHDEAGVYVSFAEDRDAFLRNMKRFGMDFEKYEQMGKFVFLDFLTVKAEGVGEILTDILQRVDSSKAKRLVIDSLTALTQGLTEGAEVRGITHTVLGRMTLGRVGVTTLLIVEKSSSSDPSGPEEFVADGVIMLRRDRLENRLLRDLELMKLRGTELRENELVFTLKGGFKVLPSYAPKSVDRPKRFEALAAQPRAYSTGSRDLDEVLGGGVPKGTTMLLEIDERVTTLEYHLFVAPMAPQFAFQGRGVIVVPSPGVDVRMLKNVAEAYGATEDEFNRLIKVAEVAVPEPVEKWPNVVALKGDDWKEDLNTIIGAAEEFTTETGQPNLLIVGLDTIIAYHGEEACERILNQSATRIRRMRSMLVALAKAGRKELTARVSPIADIHLRLVREHGCLLLYGIKPRTGLYGVEMDVSKGYPLPKLTPIV